MEISPVSSVSCKARLSRKTLINLSKEYENSIVENNCLESLLKRLSRVGSPKTRVDIGEKSETTGTRILKLVDNNDNQVSSFTIATPYNADTTSIRSTVEWLCSSDMIKTLEKIPKKTSVEVSNSPVQNTGHIFTRRERILNRYS